MQSSNPVLTRLAPGQRPGYGSATGVIYPGVVVDRDADVMTIDDVVVRTVALLATTGLSGAAAWALVPYNLVGVTLFGAAILGVAIGLVIAFARITNPAVLLTYAVVEGVAVGLVSELYQSLYQGIVLQAVTGTFGVFLVMAALYKFRVIRATPRFTRGVLGAMFGIFAIVMVNWMLSWFGIYTGLRGNSMGQGGPLAIGFSLLVIIVASLTFIVDFDLIERGVKAGMPRKTAWTCAFGLLVGLIWVYLEVLRLLSYLRGRS